MKNITEKQQRFIASLAHRTGAYAGTDGLTVGMRAYPKLDLEACYTGQASSWMASKIIELLLGQPGADTPPSTEPTGRQLDYIRSLAAKAGRQVELDGITRKEASALIDELKPLAYAAA
ncbi:hypothetical protein ACEE23_02050 [Corynebacterium sp. 32222D000AT]